MAELALGALGVVPLIGFTIKSYNALYTTAKTFRDCGRNVERLRKQLRGQRRIFQNECLFLLRRCLRDSDHDGSIDIEGMMADPGHENWPNHDLATEEEHVKKFLRQNYDECIELVQDISEAISSIHKSLAPFEKVIAQQEKNECLKKAWKRISDGTRICLHKDDYESSLKELKNSNVTLKTIREQVDHMEKPVRDISRRKRPATNKSVQWTNIRSASRTLHKALVEAWSCTQAKHLRHSAKLFIDAHLADDGVQMNIAIFGHGCDLMTGQVDMIRLQVRSTIMGISPPRLLPLPWLGPNSETGPRKRIKSVRFFDGEAAPSSDPADTRAGSSLTACPPSPDLRCSADICLELTTLCGGHESTTAAATCLGHLDVASEDGYRHKFFPATSRYYSARQPFEPPRIIGTGHLTHMNDAILGDDPVSDSLLPVDRLQMAKALVLAVLKFYDTPWLGEAWTLQDLAFFHYSQDQDLARSLQTLHVGVEFEHLPLRGITQSPITLPQMSEKERMSHGIANTTLHCLGVALLQIERSQAMEPNDVLGVRMTARSVSFLGRDYKELVERCLWCDFGLGRDLAKPQLQQAIHTSVVDTLEGMVARLAITDDVE